MPFGYDWCINILPNATTRYLQACQLGDFSVLSIFIIDVFHCEVEHSVGTGRVARA